MITSLKLEQILVMASRTSICSSEKPEVSIKLRRGFDMEKLRYDESAGRRLDWCEGIADGLVTDLAWDTALLNIVVCDLFYEEER